MINLGWSKEYDYELRDTSISRILTILVAYDRDPDILKKLVNLTDHGQIIQTIEQHFCICTSLGHGYIVDTPLPLFQALLQIPMTNEVHTRKRCLL